MPTAHNRKNPTTTNDGKPQAAFLYSPSAPDRKKRAAFRLPAHLARPARDSLEPPTVKKGATNPILASRKKKKRKKSHLFRASTPGCAKDSPSQATPRSASSGHRAVFARGGPLLLRVCWQTSRAMAAAFPGPALALCLADFLRTVMHDVHTDRAVSTSTPTPKPKPSCDFFPGPALSTRRGTWKQALRRPFARKTRGSSSSPSFAAAYVPLPS